MKKLALAIGAVLLGSTSMFAAFGPTGTTDVTLTVAAEAAIQIDTATTTLTYPGGSPAFTDFTGTTDMTYKIRTSQTTGSGSVTMSIASDFAAGGPSVASGDLTYTCGASSPATACSGSQTASTSGSTGVYTFGADAHSANAGTTGGVSWTVPNRPAYKTGSYTTTVTFTISAS